MTRTPSVSKEQACERLGEAVKLALESGMTVEEINSEVQYATDWEACSARRQAISWEAPDGT
jgi:hypothetical protein